MCGYGIWGRSCYSCLGMILSQSSLKQGRDRESQDIQLCCEPLVLPTDRGTWSPSSHCCWSSCGLECCLPILNKNLHLWELISLFRVCSWTVNRLWSPNLSSDESRVGLFPWALSGPPGTPQQALQELSWAGSGVQVWKGRLIFFLSLNFGKQNRRLKGCKTSSLLPNCFFKCPQLYKSCTYCH